MIQQVLNPIEGTLLVIVVEEQVLGKIIDELLVLDEQLVQSIIFEELVLHMVVVVEEMYDKGKRKLNDDKGKGKGIIKEYDDTSLDSLVFSNSDSSNDSHDYMSEDFIEALINFLTGHDLQWQFPKQTQEEEPKPLYVPMQTQEEEPKPLDVPMQTYKEEPKPLDVSMQTEKEDLIPLDIVYPHLEIALSSRGTNTIG
uniref:Uncharacterized protein n=1 Tax=Tanacetum cinerariifolium TaxID=118510 RepID=A0A699JDX1_TANCI|nr:hypothetical protein [Tanacetum cinerariifolium]